MTCEKGGGMTRELWMVRITIGRIEEGESTDLTYNLRP